MNEVIIENFVSCAHSVKRAPRCMIFRYDDHDLNGGEGKSACDSRYVDVLDALYHCFARAHPLLRLIGVGSS